MKENEKVSIIIPTLNNYQYLESCLNSILAVDFVAGLFHIYVVNNGHKESCDFVKGHPKVTLVNTGKNLGWEGGLKAGMKEAKGRYLLFLNDDTYVPQSSSMWLQRMLNYFHDPMVGAVGPSSNVVMGSQNIFLKEPDPIKYVNYLIGFCVMVDREKLEEVGGVDDTLPGGDDIDMSIRLRNKGYKLICDRTTFVFHHGFKTGERVHGVSQKPFGWNSYEFKERTDFALIKKHGFRKWFDTLYKPCETKNEFFADSEGNKIREMGLEGKVLDLGCGGRKTIEGSIGVDMIPKGQSIDSLSGTLSVADVMADVSKPLPFEDSSIDAIVCRHILEHMIDPITTIGNWIKVLKRGGKLVIAVPDESRIRTIPMNFEHVHAYTRETLSNLLKMFGMDVTDIIDPQNGISFIVVAVKK